MLGEALQNGALVERRFETSAIWGKLESLVSFGLMPKTNPSAQTMAAAKAIHADCLVLDAHADVVIESSNKGLLGPDGLSMISPEKLTAGGVGAVVMCIASNWGPRRPASDAKARVMADEKLAAVLATIRDNSESLVLTTSVDEIAAAKNSAKTAVLLGFQNAQSLEGDLNVLDYFYDAGVRVFALVHMGHNDYCDSSRPIYNMKTASYEVTEEHGGLSPLGREAIGRINELKAVVDVSQMSVAATLQTIELSTSPPIASHSNVRAMSDVTRNLSDVEIDAIAEVGGVIHVSAFGPSLVDVSKPAAITAIADIRKRFGLAENYSYPYELYWELPDAETQLEFQTAIMGVIGSGSIDDMIRHIDYIVDRVGVDHVGVGNDFNHGGGRIGGLADASKSLNLTVALLEHGFNAGEISKIWGDNFLRVMAAAES